MTIKTVTIGRWTELRKVKKKDWKSLISSLVMCGYEVYGDKKRIVFTLGSDDSVKEEQDV